jgi:hypothetical protein
MTDWSPAQAWLQQTKAANRSSPVGYVWHEFWQWLARAAPSRNRPTLIVSAGAQYRVRR